MQLAPDLILVGSIAEGTRVKLANELDFLIRFEGWPEPAFEFKGEDPFHLYRSGKTSLYIWWARSTVIELLLLQPNVRLGWAISSVMLASSSSTLSSTNS